VKECQDVVNNMHHLVAADKQPSTDLRYTCEVCNKKFKKHSCLIHHKLVHSQPGKYSCTNCDKRFSCVAGLKAHQRIVHNVTTGQHVCQMCNKAFTQGQNLTRHSRVVHGLDQRKRKCDSDNKNPRKNDRNVYNDDRNASADKENSHNDIENTCNEGKNAENPCYDDKNTYNSEKDCVGDMRVEQSLSNMPVNERLFTCDICYVSFKRKAHVMKHMHTHLQCRQLYPCTACAKTFKYNKSLKVHMRTHSDEKPYACVVCNSTFKWPKELSKHMRLHAEKTQLHVKCPVCSKTVASAMRLASHLSNVHKIKDTATGGDFEIVFE
jgi:KRAB domain-containing zinc finger protein